MLVQKFLESYADPTIFWTGLADRPEYHSIISSVVGQITDGIGEGSGRESAIFRYYYDPLTYVHSESKNGEFGIYVDSIRDLESLSRCIWRIAQIERSDNGVTNKNRNYVYLDDVSWKDICILQGAIRKIVDFYKSNGFHLMSSNTKIRDTIKDMIDKGEKVPGEPWTDEDAQKAADKQAAFEAKQKTDEDAAKAKADADAALAKQKHNDDLSNSLANITPDSKDVMRADDAWNHAVADVFKKDHSMDFAISAFVNKLQIQLNKITDDKKYGRRIVAFYKELLKHETDHNSAIYQDDFKREKDYLEKLIIKL